MSKIPNYVKDSILNEALNFKFGKEYEVIAQKKKELANDVYNDIYSEKVQEMMAAMPTGYLLMDEDVGVQFGKEYTRVYWFEKRLIAYKHERNAAKVYSETHKLSLKYLAIKKEYEDWRERRSHTEQSVSIILNSVSTVKKLIEVWPEGKPFIKNLEPGKVALPALPIAEVNKMLGLIPVEGAQA